MENLHQEFNVAATISHKELEHLKGGHSDMSKHFLRGIEDASVYSERFFPKIFPAIIELEILEYGQKNQEIAHQ